MIYKSAFEVMKMQTPYRNIMSLNSLILYDLHDLYTKYILRICSLKENPFPIFNHVQSSIVFFYFNKF